MCIKIIERYAVCRCIYYSHTPDACPDYGIREHAVRIREVLVGYTCSVHSSSNVYKAERPRARHQAQEEVRTNAPQPETIAEETSNHTNESVLVPENEIIDLPLDYSCMRSALEDITNVSEQLQGATGNSPESNIEMQPFETERGVTLSTVPSILEAQPSQSTVTASQHHANNCDQTHRKTSLLFVRPCYVLIFLGVLTFVGSLVPALWRSTMRNDISGAFSLAQYILGVGTFAVGSMVAIHSKTCKCWHTHNTTRVSHHEHD